MAKKNFYGVIGGREGNKVYANWDDALANTRGVSRCEHRGFTLKPNAEAWVQWRAARIGLSYAKQSTEADNDSDLEIVGIAPATKRRRVSDTPGSQGGTQPSWSSQDTPSNYRSASDDQEPGNAPGYHTSAGQRSSQNLEAAEVPAAVTDMHQIPSPERSLPVRPGLSLGEPARPQQWSPATSSRGTQTELELLDFDWLMEQLAAVARPIK